MGDIFGLMVNETRESLFQLECIAASLDNKAYGLIALNTILLSIYAYSYNVYKIPIIYISALFTILSLVSVLVSIAPRTSSRTTGENIIQLYGKLSFEDAAGQLAVNYAALEKELFGIYNKKLKYFKIGLRLTIGSIMAETLIVSCLLLSSLISWQS